MYGSSSAGGFSATRARPDVFIAPDGAPGTLALLGLSLATPCIGGRVERRPANGEAARPERRERLANAVQILSWLGSATG